MEHSVCITTSEGRYHHLAVTGDRRKHLRKMQASSPHARSFLRVFILPNKARATALKADISEVLRSWKIMGQWYSSVPDATIDRIAKSHNAVCLVAEVDPRHVSCNQPKGVS